MDVANKLNPGFSVQGVCAHDTKMHAQSKRRERLGIVEMLEAIGEMLKAKQSFYLAQIVIAFAEN